LKHPWYNRGNSLGNLGKNEEAIKYFDKAIEIKSDYFDAWYNKACTFSKLKKKEQMLKSLKKAYELNPQFKADAKKDTDFKEYWDDPEFKKLVE